VTASVTAEGGLNYHLTGGNGAAQAAVANRIGNAVNSISDINAQHSAGSGGDKDQRNLTSSEDNTLGNGSLEGIGSTLLPTGNTVEQRRLEKVVIRAADWAKQKRSAYNSKELNSGGPFATDYDGYDIGQYIIRKAKWFDDDEFEMLDPNDPGINPPEGLGINTGMTLAGPPKGVVTTVIAPTPHRYPGHYPTSQDYSLRMQSRSDIYHETAKRTGAPVVVVTPNDVYIFDK
jgi:hypothetical protein